MGLSCNRSEDPSASVSGKGAPPGPVFDVTFDDVKTFLQEYRANLQRQRLWIPLGDELKADERIVVHLKPPFFKQRISVSATVVERRHGGYDLTVAELEPRQKATLEAYSGLCESIWEECMRHLLEQVGGTSLPGRPVAPPPLRADPPAPAVPAATSIPPSAMATPPAPAAPEAAPEPAREAPAAPEASASPGGERRLEGTLNAALTRLAFEQATGRLVVDSEEGPVELVLTKGLLVQVRAAPIEERSRLGDLLVKTGVLDERARDAALAAAKSRGISLGQALTQGRKLTSQVLRRALEQQLQARLLAAVRVKPTQMRFREEPTAVPEDVTPINPSRVFYDRSVRAYTKRTPQEVSVAERQVKPMVRPSSGASAAVSLLALDSQERELWDLLARDAQALQQLYLSSPISRRQTHAVLFAWSDLGLLEFHDKV